MSTCQCMWDCKHEWCGCDQHVRDLKQQGPRGGAVSAYRPTAAEIAELRAAVLYAYEAGEPGLDGITSVWVRDVVSQPDGGLFDLIETLAALVVPPLGYLVLSRNPDTGRLQPQGRTFPTVELAECQRQYLETPPGPRIPFRSGTQLLVAEVREVQP